MNKEAFIRRVVEFDPLPYLPMFGGSTIGAGLAEKDLTAIGLGAAIFLTAKIMQSSEQGYKDKRKK